MSIVLGRIDYRLLHGIVSTQWAPQSGANRIMIIDDKTASDPTIKESMRLGKPAGMACSIITLADALANFRSGKYEDNKVFVVAAGPEVFLELVKIGQKIPKIILGLTPIRENSIKITSRVSILASEKPVYKQLIQNGTEINVKFIPIDRDLKLESAVDL